jgi:hypothetical protein
MTVTVKARIRMGVWSNGMDLSSIHGAQCAAALLKPLCVCFEHLHIGPETMQHVGSAQSTQ